MAQSEAEVRKQQAIERLIRLQAEKAIKTSMTTIVNGEIVRVPPPSPQGFSGEGNRLSEFPFESDEERDRERDQAMEVAQERLKAGVAPFAEDTNVQRLPWAKPEQPSSAVSPAAKAADEEVVPSHVPSFLSGATDVKAARAKYKVQVEWAIENRGKEQLNLVRELKRFWDWVNEPLVDVKELEHRTRQLPRIQKMLDNIEAAHAQHIKKLLDDIEAVASQVREFYQTNYKVLNSNREWDTKYKELIKNYQIVKDDPTTHTNDNLVAYFRQWRDIQEAAQKAVPTATPPSTTEVKIGLDPLDSSDQAIIYEWYKKAGGNAPIGQVMVVCSKGEKDGGTYTYKGQQYKMWHDSHGDPRSNSNDSRTAWKIMIKGKYQVVGIGYHSRGGYKAIFPFSSDTSVQLYPPQSTVTDRRT
jgi:hypothetical protein